MQPLAQQARQHRARTRPRPVPRHLRPPRPDSEDLSESLAAQELGLSKPVFARLMAAIYAIGEAPALELLMSRVRDNEAWALLLNGRVTSDNGDTIEFHCHFLLEDETVVDGSCWTPDWFRVTNAAGIVLFEGEVEHPDSPADRTGWSRYQVAFAPVRKVAKERTLARLAMQLPATGA